MAKSSHPSPQSPRFSLWLTESDRAVLRLVQAELLDAGYDVSDGLAIRSCLRAIGHACSLIDACDTLVRSDARTTRHL
jgi:hypothetical protein